MQRIREEQFTSIGGRPKRAAIYVRVRSVPHDALRESAQLRVQVEACRVVANRLGAQVVDLYNVWGGATGPCARMMVERLLQAVEAGGIDYVVVESWDRLARRPDELAQIARRVARARARLVTTGDPAGVFLEQVSLFCLMAKDEERRVA